MKINTLVIVFVHLLLFGCTLVPFYVEGDDASTIVHHVLGIDLEPVYASYHGMFDTYLSFFGNDETVLRKIAIYTSFVASIVSLLLFSYLIQLKQLQLSRFSYLIVFIVIEFLFWALLLNPTAIAFVFVMLAHIFLIKYQKTAKFNMFLWSAVCFGLGVSFRWSIGFYILVLFSEYIFIENKKVFFSKSNFVKSWYLFPIYFIGVLFFIYLSGYTVVDIYETYAFGSSYMEQKETSYLSLIATGISFFTPALLFAVSVALFWAVKERKLKALLMLLFSLMPYFLLGFYPSIKYMITTLPVLFFIIADTKQLHANKWLRVALLVFIAVPFLVGVQVESNSAWGPDFTMKSTTKDSNYIKNTHFNPDKNTTTKNIRFELLKSGCAMPTLEGPRAFWGYGAVLLFDWKHFITKRNTERNNAVSYALTHQYNIVQDVRHSFITSKLVAQQFTTKQHVNQRSKFGFERTFLNAQQQQITIQTPSNKKKLFQPTFLKENLKQDTVVLFSSYSNIVSKLALSKEVNFEQKGAYWGILNVN